MPLPLEFTSWASAHTAFWSANPLAGLSPCTKSSIWECLLVIQGNFSFPWNRSVVCQFQWDASTHSYPEWEMTLLLSGDFAVQHFKNSWLFFWCPGSFFIMVVSKKPFLVTAVVSACKVGSNRICLNFDLFISRWFWLLVHSCQGFVGNCTCWGCSLIAVATAATALIACLSTMIDRFLTWWGRGND
jgi:hypothetical protein